MSRRTRRPYKKMIKRFSPWARASHWIYVVSFLMLYITALPKYTSWEGFNYIYTIFGGPANTAIAHRVFAVLLIGTVVMMLIFDRKTFFYWMKQLTRWGKRDVAFLKVFPKEFFGGHVEYPKQDFYNAGEKINSIMQILCAIGFIASGLVMWFPQVFPAAIVSWSYPIHNISVGVAAAVVVGHIFLAVLHPNVEGGLGGMIHGDVPDYYAREHHGVWYDEVEAQERMEQNNNKKLV